MDDDLEHRLQAWVDGYVRAWSSNDPAAIGALFAQDAAYYSEPHSAPWRGRDEIVRRWLVRKDVAGETEFRTTSQTYSNLWVIRVDAEGRCCEFTEWWMQHPSTG